MGTNQKECDGDEQYYTTSCATIYKVMDTTINLADQFLDVKSCKLSNSVQLSFAAVCAFILAPTEMSALANKK